MEISKDMEELHLQAQSNMAQLTNYYQWSVGFLGQHMGRNIWDAAAGVGILAKFLDNKADKLLLTEYTPENLKILKATFADSQKHVVEFCDLNQTPADAFKAHRIDTIINLDVIEHLEDESKALSLFHETLVPGGHLLVKTPAHQALYCGIDEASLHYRRYSKKMLRQRLEAAGFEVVKIQYMNMPGAMLYFLKGKVLRKKTNFSNTIKPGGLGLMNRMIPLISKVESVLRPPFGLSVVAVARKR